MSSGFHFQDFDAPANEWHLAPDIMQQSLDQLMKSRKIDYDHDIPYLAGYSKDGMTIYVDRHFPREMHYSGKTMPVIAFIVLHECIEKALMEMLKLHYLHAHQFAESGEENAVRVLHGADGLAAYNAFCMRWIKAIAKRKAYPNVPKDLDLTPVIQEKDNGTLSKMHEDAARRAGHLP